jgi:hypothetical protein
VVPRCQVRSVLIHIGLTSFVWICCVQKGVAHPPALGAVHFFALKSYCFDLVIGVPLDSGIHYIESSRNWPIRPGRAFYNVGVAARSHSYPSRGLASFSLGHLIHVSRRGSAASICTKKQEMRARRRSMHMSMLGFHAALVTAAQRRSPAHPRYD